MDPPSIMSGDRQIVAVAAAIFRGHHVLAMRRAASKKDAGAGLWETVSGRVHPGEEPLPAIEREIVEETGLDTSIAPRPVDVYAAHRGDQPMVVLVFRADWRAGEVRRSEEHDAHVWCTPQELAERTTLTRLARAVARAARSDPA